MSKQRNERYEIRRGTGREFFAASNSRYGFKSYYDEIFNSDAIKRRYILKGGPGTGKSSLMRSVASRAEKKGAKTELCLCSSDPDSLDGVIINGETVILDGTSPHTVEATLPGVRDRIVDLGALWDEGALLAESERIKSLNREKSKCFGMSYSLLSAYGAIIDARDRASVGGISELKLKGNVERMTPKEGRGRGHSVKHRLFSSVGMKGAVVLDTPLRLASEIYYIKDCLGLGYRYLDCLLSSARKNDMAVTVYYDPILPDRINGLFFEESGRCFILGFDEFDELDRKSDKSYSADISTVNMRRFLDGEHIRSVREDYRALNSSSEEVRALALHTLSKASEYHYALEAIYTPAMDFSGFQEIADSIMF